ncbi:MAG: Fpg/Nei family DNA glycosylase [Nocardioidaceae bacterium]
MPEGHTLHRLADALTGTFGGTRVSVSSPQGRFAESAEALDGAVVEGAQAWGKHLFVDFGADRVVHVHLGLYGKFDVVTGPTRPPVGQVRLRIASGGTAVADLRGATTCTLITHAEQDAITEQLGPDPLRDDADPARAWSRLSRSRSALALLLTDQSVVAGVGNVYRAELMFRHRLGPFLPGVTIRRREWTALWDDLVTLMHEGFRTGRIDTVRPEHEPEFMGRPARKDQHGGEVYVYRRNGQPCWVCGTRVRTQVVAGRNLFWCPRCQRSRRTVPARR